MTKVSRKSLVQLLAASLIGLVGVIITLLLLPQTASASGEEPAILGVTYSVPANEGTPITVTITASDPETDTLYYSFDWDGNGSFSDPGDIEDQGSNQASYIWTDSGVFTITVGVFDNTTRVTATTTITVTAVNDPPVVSDIPDQTINEGETFVTIDLDAYVADPDNPDSEMTWSYSGNSALTVTIDGSRIATISIPTTDWNGSETITFRATDPGSLWDEDAATFTVTAVNDPPVVSDIPDQT
ncbi:MAG: Ig-like domain-containing protein, partial [Anaerolineae bacterium]